MNGKQRINSIRKPSWQYKKMNKTDEKVKKQQKKTLLREISNRKSVNRNKNKWKLCEERKIKISRAEVKYKKKNKR